MGPDAIVAVACGVVFILILLGMAAWIIDRDREPPPTAQFILRTVLALAAAGFAAALAGTLQLKFAGGPLALRATAGFALAVLIYLVNPPERTAKAVTGGIGRPKWGTKPPKASQDDPGQKPQ